MIRKISDWFMTHRLPIIVLASVIVIITTYMLVLPAFTLTFEKAKEQGGISVDSIQTRSEDSKSVQAEAPAKDSDESENSAAASDEDTSKDSGADQSKDEDKDSSEDESKDSGDDQSKDGEAKAEDTDEKGEEAKEGQDEQKEDSEAEDKDEEETEKEPEYKEMVLSSVLNDKEKVTVKIGKDAKVPEGSSLVVSELLAGKDAQKAKKEISEEESKADVTEITQSEYDSYINESEKVLGWDDKSAANARMLDIKIVDKDGKKVKIAAPVDVKIELLDEGKNNDLSVVHFADVEYKAAKEENNTDDQTKGEFKSRDEVVRSGEIQAADASKVQDLIAHSGKLSFEADGFSVYVIVGTTIEKTILASDGNNYKISVTYGSDTGIPVNADLDVEEFTKEISDYDSYVKRTEDAIGVEEGSASYIRLFDIKIVNKDDHSIKYQPVEGTTVDVRIELADAEDREELNVVHFADGSEKGEKLNNNTESINEGQAVEFEADGFSVYAVVDGSTDDYARMKVEFYSEGHLIATMYVKNGDTATELETILYDPGVGALGTDEVFDGWILDKPSYTTADLDKTMTIADIREWAEALPITEGDTHRFDAAICKLYKITYKDDDGTVLGLDSIPVVSSKYGIDDPSYTVLMAYTPKDDVHNFEGWKLDEGSDEHVTSDIPADRVYTNNSSINIKGDISFTVYAPPGAWLIFDENGKGGKYNAPQFVKSDEVTHRPCPDADMTRNGYRFDGWYDTKAHADAHGANPAVTTGAFNFGSGLDRKTTIYASWIPNTTAPYTVIFWTENAKRTGYDLKESTVLTGTVGQNIPYTFRDNIDEDYVRVGNKDYHYTGFCMQPVSEEVVITPEGDAVLNIYFKRIEYKFRFYYYRQRAGNNPYNAAQYSARYTGNGVYGVAQWYTNWSTNRPTQTYGPDRTAAIEGYTAHYFELSAYYGEDISSKWPSYDQLSDYGNYAAVSFVMMNGTGLKKAADGGNGYGQGKGSDTIKGLITTMDEMILGKTNDANGNFVVVRYSTKNTWQYHIMYEQIEGVDYTGKITYKLNGVDYYQDRIVDSRSTNANVAEQNHPQYSGFEYVAESNQTGQSGGTDGNNARWTTGSGSNTVYHVRYYYNRIAYPINYMDGTYFDGRGSIIQSKPEELLHTSEGINYEAYIPDQYKEYVPELPAGESGYVFDGWYADSACNTPYDFDTMPMGGIVVYAKWVQKQYRVFLHPNAGHDPNLDWGSSTVQTSFRVDYGGKVSTPTGTREGSGYEFVGWYTDPNMTAGSLYVADTILNDSTVTTPYNKTEDTELDKWGYSEREGYNSDAANERFWITNKLDLYARWRKIIDDAEGISVIYTPDDGDGHVGTYPPEDPTIYPDKAFAPAQGASTAPDGYYFKCWVVQTWDENAGKYVDTDISVFPGEKFTIDVEKAHKEPIPGQEGKYTYKMQLRAEYVEAESEFPTHIWWFNNYSDTGAARHQSAHEDENILINEAVNILTAPTREGYTFEGWARVPINISGSDNPSQVVGKPTGKVLDYDTVSEFLYLKYEDGVFKLNDSTSQYNGSTVTQVAADERQLYHDMYAVWKPNTFTVTVKKTVDSEDQLDKMKDFVFTPNTALAEYAPEGSLVGGKFKLKDSQTLVFEDVPFNTVISLAETIDPDFAPSATKTVTSNSKGEPIPDPTPEPIALSGGSTGNIKVKGSMVIEYTNTPSTKVVSVWKTNEDHTKLTGASFELYKADDYDDTTGQPKEGRTPVVESTPVDTNGLLPLGILPNGEYRLVETVTPDGYIPAESAIKIFVTADAVRAMQGTSDSEVYRYPNQYMVPDQNPDTWQIRVWNNPGVELPHTGGSGVTLIYFAGILMILISGAALVIRRKVSAK